ncbi:MAG: CpsD/CapB family tyrosine-protein kinase [Calditrichaeota bacterium]|nr:CpsD/CapB family tyrosine-protein kinase [Calditrichota bacterium]
MVSFVNPAEATTREAAQRVASGARAGAVGGSSQLTHVAPRRAVSTRDKTTGVLKDLKAVAHVVESVAARTGARVIGLTSALPGEGVSTCAAAISFLLAADGEAGTNRGRTGSLVLSPTASADAVILVDANVGDPFIHRAFALPLSPGLSDGLRQVQSLADMAHRVEGSHLLVIPAGSGRRRADLQQLGTALQQAAERVRLVVLDLPAVLGSAEGVRYAMLCDAVVLVVRANHTRWEAVVQAQRTLERAGVPILGAILNRRRFDLPRWLYERL